MRKTCWISIALLVSTACSSPTEPFAGLRVETSISRYAALGAPVGILTTVTNDSKRVVTFEGSTCPARFRVETSTGSPLLLGTQICTASATMITLAPGATYRFVEQWDGKDRNGIQITGTYRVIGQPFADSGPQSAPVVVQLP